MGIPGLSSSAPEVLPWGPLPAPGDRRHMQSQAPGTLRGPGWLPWVLRSPERLCAHLPRPRVGRIHPGIHRFLHKRKDLPPSEGHCSPSAQGIPLRPQELSACQEQRC